MTRTVAFVLPSLAGGGAERVALMLVRNLDRGRFAPRLILFERAGPLGALIPADMPVTDLARPRLRHARGPLIAALRDLRPDAIYSTFGYVNLALLAARRQLPSGARLVLREANLPSLSLPQARFGRLMAVGYHRWYRRADAVIASSERMADEFASTFKVPRTRLSVLPNLVDESAIRAAATTPKRAIDEGLRFLAAGRLIAQKGFDRLLDMFADLPQDAHLTILGEGQERPALEAKVAALGLQNQISLPGFMAEPWAFYAGADAFLLPSRWEGMPNVALEALASGTRVIATPESGGIAELAAAAPAGAITIAEAGAPFVAAMRAVEPAAPTELRPSLLPAEHRIENVVAAFETILAGPNA